MTRLPYLNMPVYFRFLLRPFEFHDDALIDALLFLKRACANAQIDVLDAYSSDETFLRAYSELLFCDTLCINIGDSAAIAFYSRCMTRLQRTKAHFTDDLSCRTFRSNSVKPMLLCGFLLRRTELSQNSVF